MTIHINDIDIAAKLIAHAIEQNAYEGDMNSIAFKTYRKLSEFASHAHASMTESEGNDVKKDTEQNY